MEKQSGGRKKARPPPKNLPADQVFGANGLQLSEDTEFKLVGSIVEKGISDGGKPTLPSSAPQPTVLPFPVARHRSHGPHWAPKVNEFRGVGNDDDQDEEEEDNDTTNYHPIAEFAKPIKRKKKKGLDLRKWRELLPSNNPSISSKEGNNSVISGLLMQNAKGEAIEISSQKSKCDVPSLATISTHFTEGKEEMGAETSTHSVGSISALKLDGFDESSRTTINYNGDSESRNGTELQKMSSDDAEMRNDELTLIDKPKTWERDTALSLMSSGFGYEEAHMSIESQIDAENLALLQKMSRAEVAEAEAEVREKLNPRLLDFLQKRGQQKLEKQRNSGLGSAANNGHGHGGMQVDKNLIQDEKGSLVTESIKSPSAMNITMQNSEKRPDKITVQKLSSSAQILWDAWSERVEAVRDLRFSLDGNVVQSDFIHASETGKNLDPGGYGVDNVAERDYFRTEGDPAAAGYTIKEALALTRSVVPGQRTLALHLLASVLNKSLYCIHQNQVGSSMGNAYNVKNLVDWEAIWAFALGPEPELALSLRIALDDNHDSVVLACAKVIECVLACDENETFFHITEKKPAYVKELYTAPVFRARPEMKFGFLRGGYWKYNTKPSNILPLGEDILDDSAEGQRTIQDDNAVAGQDIAAGLVRMRILPRLCYLLEMGPTVALEECILSILIALARHSPTCADAIFKCQRLVQIVVERFTMKNESEVQTTQIKSVALLRVLALSDHRSCLEFVKKGIFHNVTWHLYHVTSSIDGWVKSGWQHCKLASELMVEQLRFWKVCIEYGHCVSYFTAMFPALCLWLSTPTLEKLVEKNVLHEFASISREAYLVLEALARRLPNFYSHQDIGDQFSGTFGDSVESWCWNYVAPVVDLALKWVEFSSDSSLSKLLDDPNGTKSLSMCVSSLLWVISAVLHMLWTVLIKATPLNTLGQDETLCIRKPLPGFVAKIGCQIVKSGFLSFGGITEYSTGDYEVGSFVEKLSLFRSKTEYETSLAAVCCLHGVLQVVVSIDHLIQLSKTQNKHPFSQGSMSSLESRIFDNGILKCSLVEWKGVLTEFMKLVTSRWHLVQGIEVFGRGGPAPGIGLGWGASGGGFWSSTITLVQADARLLVNLLEILHSSPAKDLPGDDGKMFMQMVNSALAACLTAGPRDRVIVEKAFDTLLQINVLKYLDLSIHQFLQKLFKLDKGQKLKWKYEEDDFVLFRKILNSHFRKRWLSVKKKKPKAKDDSNSPGHKTFKKSISCLDAIHEDEDTAATTSEHCTALAVEWAQQRLPLPSPWVLSPIATISDDTRSDVSSASSKAKPEQVPTESVEVAKAGLFFLLGIEAMSYNLSDEDHPRVLSIPLAWKLHSLSAVLLIGMGVLEDERSRDIYGALQSLYGQHLTELRFSSGTAAKVNNEILLPENWMHKRDLLRFQSEISESYSTFIDVLVEQFASVSYGDLAYGRQLAMYLHCQVEAPVRLAAWNALSNARVLDLLPPLDKCIAEAQGYLEPIEEEEGVLEAYVKSWSSGALDRAATRGSMAYTIALHHLSSFIFNDCSGEKLSLQSKFAKSLLRDFSRKQQHEAMMLDLIRLGDQPYQTGGLSGRFQLLKEACEGNSSLLSAVDKLKASFCGPV
ncbi:hypothetical protein Ancab_017295 [Ancistrocladus abbreviatus]